MGAGSPFNPEADEDQEGDSRGTGGPEEFLRSWRGKRSGPETDPSGQRSAREPPFVIAEQVQEIRTELADTLQDELGQQLAGALLAAGALWTRLDRRDAPEEREAAYLLDMSQSIKPHRVNARNAKAPRTASLAAS